MGRFGLSDEVGRFGQSRTQRAPSNVQKRYRGPYWTPSQRFIREGNTEIFAVKRIGELPLFHVKIHAQNAPLFEGFAILATLSIISVPQLAQPIEAKTEFKVAKGCVRTEFLLRRHANFEFVFGARVSYHLPIVFPVHEGPIAYYISE